MRKRWRSILAAIMPGLFLIGFNIGTGSVTTMAKAGAEHGASLLWTLVVSCAITYRMISLYSRFTMVTGETALAAFRRWIHPSVGLFFLVALSANVIGSVIGVMGVIASVSSLWALQALGYSVHPFAFALLFSGLVYGLFWAGKTRCFEQSMAIMVATMGLCFVVNSFLNMPSLGTIIAGLIPVLPEDAGGNSLLVVASMVGTTVFSGLFIVRTILIKEVGWTIDDYPTQERDARFAGLLMLVLSAAIMLTAASCFHGQKVVFDDTTQMLRLLEPLAGSLSVGLFAFGVVAAGLSSQFPNVLLFPWLYCDYRGIPFRLSAPFFRWIVAFISLLGLTVPLFGGRPILVMVTSQAFGALLLPASVVCILYLGNRRSLMGKNVLRWPDNLFLVVTLVFALIMALIGFRGIVAIIGTWIS